MSGEPMWRRYLRFWGPNVRADVEEEIEFHLELLTDRLVREGMSPEAARERAREEFGDIAWAKRRCQEIDEGRLRRVRQAGRLGALGQDLRFAIRLIPRNPGFTLAAVLTLALGIGANTAIFNVVNALLLRPLPGVERQEELVMLGRTDSGSGFDTFSYADFIDYRDATRTLSGVAAYSTWPVHLSTGRQSERVIADVVSGSYFRVLGVPAALGRTFLPEEDAAGARPVAVITHSLWQRRFGGDPGVVGSVIRLNGHPFTVIGVSTERFAGVQRDGAVDLFVPLSTQAAVMPGRSVDPDQREMVWLELFGRLGPGVAPETASRELGAIAARIAREHPDTNRDRGIAVSPGLGYHPSAREEVRQFLGILLGVVTLVLLIACANVANLLLARAVSRRREVAVRASLGASRGRLVRQLLTESLTLALLGGGAGVLLALLANHLMPRLPIFADLPAPPDLRMDWRVFGFAATVALLSGLAFGLAPAFRASRSDLASGLREGTPGGGAARSRLRSGLLSGQIAVSLVLLVAAGLFVRTLVNLYRTEPGFETGRVMIASVDVGLQGYDESRGRRFYEQLLERVSALPGVRSASLANMVPLSGGGWDTRTFAGGALVGAEDEGLKTDRNAVTPDYFATMGMKIVRGRGFTAGDRAGAPPVAVVNRAVAERLWPDQDPVGKALRLGREGELVEVVGVVEDAKYRSLLEDRRPFVYHSFAQVYRPGMTLHVRSDGHPAALVPLVAREVRALDPDLPLYRVRTMADWLDRSLGAQRTAASLIGVFGLLALILAAVGLYGSMAYLVSQRTREIGIRMALGARVREISGLVLRDAFSVLGAGILVGVVMALALTRVLEGQLFGVSPADPATFACVAALLVAVVLLASYLPARRATRVDPVVALRAD